METKEEYIFLNKKYETAVTVIKAQLFDVISNEEKKAMRIGLEMNREGISEEKMRALQELALKQGESLGRVITLTSKLSDTLIKLDSYTKTLRDLRKESVSTAEIEKNVQDAAAEVIVSINETNVSQDTKDKVIENVGVIAEATQVAMPEVPNVQPLSEKVETQTDVVEDVQPAVLSLSEDVVKLDDSTATQAVEEPTKVDGPVIASGDTVSAVVEVVEDENENEEENAPAIAPVAETAPVEEAKTEAAPLIALDEAPAVTAEVQPEPVIAPPTEEVTASVDAGTPLIVIDGDAAAQNALLESQNEATVEVKPAEPAAIVDVQPEVAAPVAPIAPEVQTEAAPLIAVSEPVVAVESQPEAAPVAEVTESALLIPLEEPAVDKVEETQQEMVLPESAPLIPVEEPAVAVEVQPEVAPVAEVTESAPLIPLQEEVAVAPEVSVVAAPDSPSDAAKVVEEAANPVEEQVVTTEEVAPVKEVFTKEDKLNPKALLTSSKQITNLRKSLATQEALLDARSSLGTSSGTFVTNDLETQLVDNGLLPADVDIMKKQVEQMMEQANALYKDGKTDEAQKMYDKISELNKQIQEKTSTSLSV